MKGKKNALYWAGDVQTDVHPQITPRHSVVTGTYGYHCAGIRRTPGAVLKQERNRKTRGAPESSLQRCRSPGRRMLSGTGRSLLLLGCMWTHIQNIHPDQIRISAAFGTLSILFKRLSGLQLFLNMSASCWESRLCFILFASPCISNSSQSETT